MWTTAEPFKLTLPIWMTVLAVGGESVDPPALPVQNGAPAGHPPELKVMFDVGGVIFGGVGSVIGCGSWTRFSVTVAKPEIVAAVTLFAVQLPTPDFGVESVPLIVVVLPLPSRLPLVPTLPPVLAMPAARLPE